MYSSTQVIDVCVCVCAHCIGMYVCTLFSYNITNRYVRTYIHRLLTAKVTCSDSTSIFSALSDSMTSFLLRGSSSDSSLSSELLPFFFDSDWRVAQRAWQLRRKINSSKGYTIGENRIVCKTTENCRSSLLCTVCSVGQQSQLIVPALTLLCSFLFSSCSRRSRSLRSVSSAASLVCCVTSLSLSLFRSSLIW